MQRCRLRSPLLVCWLLVGGCGAAQTETQDTGGSEPSAHTTSTPTAAPPLPDLAVTFVPANPPAPPLYLNPTALGAQLFAATPQGLSRSDDYGVSFSPVSSTPGSLLAIDSSGVLYAGSGLGLFRSQDAAKNFDSLSLPSGFQVANLLLSGDDAVWLLSQDSPPRLVRSLDQGVQFDEVALPEGQFLKPCRSLTDHLVFVADGTLVRVAADGTTNITSELPPVLDCVVLPSGTILVSGTDTPPSELRFPLGDAPPERRETDSLATYLATPKRLLRSIPGGDLEESFDDGVTFERLAIERDPEVSVSSITIAEGALVGLTPRGSARLLEGQSVWQETVYPGVPGGAVRDLAFAKGSERRALLVDTNTQRTLFVTEDGVDWVAGAVLRQAEATCIAIHPTDGRVVVGGVSGQYRIFDADGKTLLHIDPISSAGGAIETNDVLQIVWEPDPAGSVIIASTGDATDTNGNLWQLDGEADHYAWDLLTPYSTAESPALRRGSYRALAVSDVGPNGHRALTTALRSFVTTATFTSQLLTQPRLFDSGSSWNEAEPPVLASPILAATYAGPYDAGVALLFSENRIAFGPFISRLHSVPITSGNMPSIELLRFDAGGRLWLGTQGGLYRSSQPLALPPIE